MTSTLTSPIIRSAVRKKSWACSPTLQTRSHCFRCWLRKMAISASSFQSSIVNQPNRALLVVHQVPHVFSLLLHLHSSLTDNIELHRLLNPKLWMQNFQRVKGSFWGGTQALSSINYSKVFPKDWSPDGCISVSFILVSLLFSMILANTHSYLIFKTGIHRGTSWDIGQEILFSSMYTTSRRPCGQNWSITFGGFFHLISFCLLFYLLLILNTCK